MTANVAPIRLLVLDGDGIGPETCAATVRTLEAAGRRFGIDFVFERLIIGFEALALYGTTFPPEILAAAKRNDGIILGSVSHNEYPPVAKGGLNPSGELRKQLDLYANIRPAVARRGIETHHGSRIDLVIVRENTEGFYADRSMHVGPGELMPTPDMALAVRKITRASCLRIVEQAFVLASRRRKKVTAVHKANVMRLSDGLFLECAREIASRFPEIEYEEKLVDSVAALLVRDASIFDVIVTTNMFGDILSDEASEIAGSLGLAASLNAGERYAAAQAQHGSAPDIAGQDIANPTSLISSAAMLLDWIGARNNRVELNEAAKAIEDALSTALENKETRTRDLSGSMGTRDFTTAVIARLEKPS